MATQIVPNNPYTTSLIEEMDIQIVQKTMQKIAAFQQVVQKALKKELDYGVIPGTIKPTLLKPGGEKICMMLGVNPEYDLLNKTEEYEKGFFAYNIKCTLKKNEKNVAQGLGNCNSFEKRYRWINTDIIPEGIDPVNTQSFIDRYGRLRYKIPNPNPCDLANTILKMAKKRAFVDAVLQVASLSEIFTQDIEEMQEFIKEEETVAANSMNVKEAATIKVNFGKYKGQSLKDIYKEDTKYFEWLMHNTNDPLIKEACDLMQKEVEKKE